MVQLSSAVLVIAELALVGCAALACIFVSHLTNLQDGAASQSAGGSLDGIGPTRGDVTGSELGTHAVSALTA